MKFENGYTVRILFSKHNSCDRFSDKDRAGIFEDAETKEVESPTAEVIVIDNKGNVIPFENQSSLMYQSPKEITDILFRASIAKIPSDMHNFDLSNIQKEDEWS